MEVLAIKREMDVDFSSVNRIKTGLTLEEIAIVNERLEELPGVEVKIDSERKYGN